MCVHINIYKILHMLSLIFFILLLINRSYFLDGNEWLCFCDPNHWPNLGLLEVRWEWPFCLCLKGKVVLGPTTAVNHKLQYNLYNHNLECFFLYEGLVLMMENQRLWLLRFEWEEKQETLFSNHHSALHNSHN